MGSGQLTLIGCPRKFVAEDESGVSGGGDSGGVADLLEAAELADKGSWPVAGGWLDQCRSCIDGVRLVRMREAIEEAKGI
jgi:hypothetical protein